MRPEFSDLFRFGENRFSVSVLGEGVSSSKDLIPEVTGVYFFEDARGSVLYVGKAVNLRRRLLSYFRPPLPLKTASMMKKAVAFEFVITRNEKEALLLEAQLIKKLRPPYNIILRDDKNYPSIRISLRDPFPRLETVRRVRRDGAFYFGPYPSAHAMGEVVRILRKAFPLRKCPGQNLVKRQRPCINYDLGLCLAPCAGKVTQRQYHVIVRDLIRFLNGDNHVLKEKLTREMREAAEKLEFEKAAIFRDRLIALDAIMERQAVVLRKRLNRDILGYFPEGDHAFISIVYVRSGIITGHKNFHLSGLAEDQNSAISSFISRYYDTYPFIPDEILLPVSVEEREGLEEYLSEIRGAQVTIICGANDDNERELLDLALSNAKEHAKATLSHSNSWQESMKLLRDLLNLDPASQTIACVDISNLQGKYTVGAVVIFKSGFLSPRFCKTYPLGELTEQNDPAMIQTTIEKLATEDPILFKEIDLLMVDGGRGQLHGAMKAVEDNRRKNLDGDSEKFPAVLAIAKERTLDTKHERLLAEKLYLPYVADPIPLSDYPKVRKFLQMIRDEAHRCALNAYQREHRKALHASTLDSVKGVGPKRKKILLKFFGSIEAIKQAEFEDLLTIPGIPEEVAKNIYEFFHPNR